jgi:hypothetical protein
MSMAASGSMRASDRERDRVVEFLKEQTAQGRLTMEELEERSGAAYAAKTRLELQQLTEDLPEAIAFERDERGARTARAPARTPAWRLVLACCCGMPRRWRV